MNYEPTNFKFQPYQPSLSVFDEIVNEIARLQKPALCFSLLLSQQAQEGLFCSDLFALCGRFRRVITITSLDGCQFVLREEPV